mgnify:CR=1 FL=1
MAAEIFLQNEIFTRFVFPFLLIFFIVFAILEKTKIFGEDKKQLDALVAFVIGLIFIAFTYPTVIATNMILFLTIAIVVSFVGLLLWGFVSGQAPNIGGEKWVKWIGAVVIIIAVILALIWAMNLQSETIDFLFKNDWSNTFWTNVAFVVVIAIALALVMRKWE